MADTTDTTLLKAPAASVEEMQQGWHELQLRVTQLEAERAALEHENKTLRHLFERVVEHRQKSHGELVLLLAGLVSKLPITDVGLVVSRLVEHNAHVAEVCAALAKGKVDSALPQPAVLRALDQTKRELAAALKPAVEQLIQLDTPFEIAMLRALVAKPELFFSPIFVRANRCFVKGQVLKERILREFGEAALVFFNDHTTDPKLNPRPKPEEIVLAFKPDFEAWFAQNPNLLPDKRADLLTLYQKIQRLKAPTPESRAQRNAFMELAFILELIHYYDHQDTEIPEAIFAQRLPVLIEQMVLLGATDRLDEKLILKSEHLLAYILNVDYRLTVINNIGKSGSLGRTLRFVLRLRVEKSIDPTNVVLSETIAEFVKHLIPPPPQKPPTAEALAVVLRLVNTDLQKLVVKAIVGSDRVKRDEADTIAKALAKELNLPELEQATKVATVSPEVERQLAWDKVKDLIGRRAEPSAIATAIRDRLHARYDAEEVKQSWITLVEADVISFIRAFCQLPYLPDGSTDTIARPVMEAYVSRLTHEKYAATYHKVVTSLKNMFRAKPDSPTLLNFIALVRWVDAAAANKLSADVGMAAPAH
ncbi:MAG: hypothetical protein U1F83_14685 [Verrucomicrobiota bacterium]